MLIQKIAEKKTLVDFVFQNETLNKEAKWVFWIWAFTIKIEKLLFKKNQTCHLVSFILNFSIKKQKSLVQFGKVDMGGFS